MENLPSLLTLTRALHITAGGVALSSMWIPMLARKGSSLHRRAGWLYTAAMGVVALSGTGLAVAALTAGRTTTGAFLLYVALLTATNAWLGVRAFSRSPSRAARVLDVVFPAALTLASIALGVGAVRAGSVLLGGFALLGGFLGVTQLRTWVVPARTPTDRVMRHIGGMGGSCIATVTAFLVVNAGRMGLSGSVLPWFAPAVVGGVLLALGKRRHAGPRRGASLPNEI